VTSKDIITSSQTRTILRCSIYFNFNPSTLWNNFDQRRWFSKPIINTKKN